MAAQIQQVYTQTPHRKQMLMAADILRDGGIVVYPTDTIYGLGADCTNRQGIQGILTIKQSSSHKLLSLICSNLQQVAQWAHVPNEAFRIMKKVLPGPYTFILKASSDVPKALVHQKRKTIGIRIPDSPVALALVEALERPLLSGSVPLGEDDYMTDPMEIATQLRHQVDLVLDAGPMPNQPSTIIDFSQGEPELVRLGAGPIDGIL